MSRRNSGNTDNKIPDFPLYLVLDVSEDMAPDIDRLNGMLGELRDRMLSDPLASATILVSVISFGLTAAVEVPLGHFGVAELPVLTVNGSARYSEVFMTLRKSIEKDLTARNAAITFTDQFGYYRPVAFFLAAGQPSPDDLWQQEFTDLTSIKAHPLLVPVGCGDASEAILRQLVHPRGRSKLYMAGPSDGVAVLSELLELVIQELFSAHNHTGTAVQLLPGASDFKHLVQVHEYVGG